MDLNLNISNQFKYLYLCERNSNFDQCVSFSLLSICLPEIRRAGEHVELIIAFPCEKLQRNTFGSIIGVHKL